MKTLFDYITADEARELIAAGADVNERGELDSTPLHMAAEYGSTDVIRILLEAGANPGARNKNGVTPLHYAVLNNRAGAIQLLLEDGFNVNDVDKRGNTPLHYAADVSREEILELLLKFGADVNAKNKDGATPLHYAVWMRRTNAARVLLKHKASINSRDIIGETPLHNAVHVNCSELFEVLLNFGADPNAKNNKGQTPLNLCRNEYIASLLKQAMNKHEQDNNTIKTKTAQVIPMQKEQEEYKKVMSSAFHELRRSTTARKLRLLESILEAIYHLPSESDEAKPLLDVARGAIEELNGGKPVTREDTREIVVGYEDEDCIVPTVYNKDYPYHVYANERDMMNLITRKQYDLFRDHPDALAELFEADKMVTYIN